MQGFCDPNPTEYVDMEVTKPNVVFYWGLNPSRSGYTDIESVEEDFMRNINNGFQESPGRMKLSIIQASQVPKSALRDTGSGKWTKACWKLMDYNQRRIPMYSQHLPHYFVKSSLVQKNLSL
jgi:poly(A) polymerase